MKKILFFLLALVAYGNTLWAQDPVTAFDIEDVMITQGATDWTPVTVKIVDEGPDNIIGFQFDLSLPKGIEADYDSDGLIYDMSNTQPRSWRGFPLSVNFFNDESGLRIRILGSNSSNAKLNRGEVFTFYIKANDTFTTSAEALVSGIEGKTSNIVLSTKLDDGTQTKIYQAPFTFNIVTPLDENKSYEFFNPYTGKVKVLRNIGAGKWNTICLPFNMDATQIASAFGDNAIVAKFNGYDKHEKDGKITGFGLHFNSTTTISAHTPYLIKVGSSVSDFELDPVSITDAGVTPSDGAFVGTYQNLTNFGSEAHPYLFLSGNQFFFAIGNTNMKSFRGYFDLGEDLATYRNSKNGDSGNANVTVFVDDEATSISGMSIDQPIVDAVYDLQGRVVKVENNDLNSLQKGVYIVNGQKITIK